VISHLICSIALIALIFVLPYFYAIIVDNIRMDMVRRELKEITDYVSNTIANLYFLVNSSEVVNVSLQKELMYLPSNVEDFVYILEIVESNEYSLRVTAYLRDRPYVAADSWLTSGLKIDTARSSIVSSGLTFLVGCFRNSTGVYAWIGYG
jgi:hypothetical protein